MGRLQNARVTHHHTPTTSSQPHDAFRRTVLLPLALQMAHIGLSCGWNAIGLWRVAQGQAPLGPSASWLVLVLAVLAGGCMVVGAWRRPAWYAVASAAMVLALIAPMAGVFILDAGRWPSPYWRWGGFALNGAGLLAGLWGLQRWRRYRARHAPGPVHTMPLNGSRSE